MKSSDLIRKLEEDGWVLKRITGSHHSFKHPTKAHHHSATPEEGSSNRDSQEHPKDRRPVKPVVFSTMMQ